MGTGEGRDDDLIRSLPSKCGSGTLTVQNGTIDTENSFSSQGGNQDKMAGSFMALKSICIHLAPAVVQYAILCLWEMLTYSYLLTG